MIKKICALSFAILISVSVAMATDQDHSKMNHGTMDHSSMNHDATATMDKKHTMAMGEGVIHSVSKLNRTVNLTHEPIPELNWPEMQMDLAVSKDVDLNGIKAGDKVKFHLMLDDDNVYRIHQFEK